MIFQNHRSDLLLSGGTVLNVYTGELLPQNVAVKGGRISYVGGERPETASETRVLDVSGRVLVPGYVDPHFHPWFIFNPISFGEAACARGITTLFCDNLIFYMLMGVERFEAFMERLQDVPVTYYWWARAVPQTPMEEERELFSTENIERLLSHPRVQSVGEITRWQDLARGNPDLQEIVRYAKALRKRVDGHTAGARWDHLVALAGAGVESCHESIRGEEVVERLRLGMYAMLRESSLRQDLHELLRTVKQEGLQTDRIMLTTDCSSPAFYEKHGIHDRLIRIALEEGFDPVTAYRMCTITPAVYFGMDHAIGGIAPGRQADVLVLRDLTDPLPETVLSRGRIVARNGVLESPFPETNWEACLPPPSFVTHPWRAKADLFRIPSPQARLTLPGIRLVSAVITRKDLRSFPVERGAVRLEEDYSYVALLERSGKWVTNGVLGNFGPGVEGLASSFNTAAQILVIGRSPKAMALAVNRVMEMGGGIVVVEDGQPLFELPLPLGGIMSERPLRELAERENALLGLLRSRGYPFHDPLYTLVFLPNDFLPALRIHRGGVVDIRSGEVLRPRQDLQG